MSIALLHVCNSINLVNDSWFGYNVHVKHYYGAAHVHGLDQLQVRIPIITYPDMHGTFVILISQGIIM